MSEKYPYFEMREHTDNAVYIILHTEKHYQGRFHMATFFTISEAKKYIKNLKNAQIKHVQL